LERCIVLLETVRDFIGREIVASPHGRFQGFRLDLVEIDCAVLRLPHAAHNMNQNGRLNGGATLALIDTAATAAAWASNAVVPGKTRGTTVSVTTSFLAPAGASDLVAEARVIRRGRRLSVVSVSVSNAGGEVASGLVTYSIELKRGA
jgi:uncharacterized protein (TIGR00369 family)